MLISLSHHQRGGAGLAIVVSGLVLAGLWFVADGMFRTQAEEVIKQANLVLKRPDINAAGKQLISRRVSALRNKLKGNNAFGVLYATNDLTAEIEKVLSLSGYRVKSRRRSALPRTVTKCGPYVSYRECKRMGGIHWSEQ